MSKPHQSSFGAVGTEAGLQWVGEQRRETDPRGTRGTATACLMSAEGKGAQERFIVSSN